VSCGRSDRRESFDELERARRLGPRIADAQPEIEASRELPAELTRALAEQGMFRLLLPRSFGGHELGLPQFIRVVEAIGEADGSTGWCVSQGAVFASLAPILSPETANDIWGEDPGAVVATGVPVGSEAQESDGGHRLTGRWRFASGCRHAGWLAASTGVVAADGKAVAPRTFLLPREQVTIEERWNVRGMRGTGSHDYTLDGLQVPLTRSIEVSETSRFGGASTGIPVQLLFACGFGAVALGLARRAIDAFVDVAQGKTPIFTNTKLLDDELAQTGLGHAEAVFGATRAFLLDAADESDHANATGSAPSLAIRTQLRLAATHAMQCSATVIDEIYSLAGTDAMFQDHPIQRCFQDVHALTQQVQARTAHYRTAGRVLLGLEPRSGFI
jgi:alkylation response protein AidB-like acyl-CoA dehydrogenase